MQENKRAFDLGIMARVLQVSLSGYHAWKNRLPSSRDQQNNAFITTIKEVHEKSRGSYGSPRVTATLEKQGLNISENRVARLMRESGLQGKHKRRGAHKKPKGTGVVMAQNVLDRNFVACKPNQKWVTDITYLPTTEGWLYLAVVLLARKTAPDGLLAQDLFSRRIIGWAMDTTLETGLVVAALGMAQQTRRPEPGLLVHSDQGVQFRASEYVQALSRLKAVQSMSRRGNCLDNAVCESFFATLKTELGLSQTVGSRAFTKGAIFEWIEVFYNRERLHSSLGFRSPVEFETSWQVEVFPVH